MTALAGAQYVNKMIRMHTKKEEMDHLHAETTDVVKREIDHRERHAQNHGVLSMLTQRWQHAALNVLQKVRSHTHYRDHFNVTAREHMSGVDCYDGKRVRRGQGEDVENSRDEIIKEDLLVIHPVVDGRLKDVARN